MVAADGEEVGEVVDRSAVVAVVDLDVVVENTAAVAIVDWFVTGSFVQAVLKRNRLTCVGLTCLLVLRV